MRAIRAGINDSYYVHKTLCEYFDEIKQPNEELRKSYHVWLSKLSDENQFYFLLLHGRKPIGMIWGRQIIDEPKKTILFEGKFLRRAYRGKGKIDADFEKLYQDLKKDFEVVRLLIPKGQDILDKYKVIATLVEE
jgi:hypothetical protein